MARALDETLKRAERGFTAAQIGLGHSYLTGQSIDNDSVPQDFMKAKHWLEQAHEKGAFTETYLLGTVYEDGKGVSIDMGKAISLYEQAVERGAYLPCVNLARIYAQGKGVARSSDIAGKWYKKLLSFEGQVDDSGQMEEARNYLRAHMSG